MRTNPVDAIELAERTSARVVLCTPAGWAEDEARGWLYLHCFDPLGWVLAGTSDCPDKQTYKHWKFENGAMD